MSEPFICPKEWKLSPQQERFFELVMDAPDTISRGAIQDEIAPYAYPKLIDVMLHNIRKKLAPFNVTILSSWGRGLRIEADAKELLRAGAVSLPETRENPVRRSRAA